MKSRASVALVALLLALGGAAWWGLRARAPAEAWRTVEVTRTDVRQVVSATGTLDAVTTVEVGTQVSGILAEILVDFNDRVTRGQLLARIDTALLDADVASAHARLAEAMANRDRLALDEARIEALHARAAVTDQELEAAHADAAIADAQVRSAEVALSRARRNLAYATITSPIDGTIIQRDVDVGQTVNAGLSAPTLFLIAGDLARMQILANVDESDIGQIREGQAVSFTVQAFPERTFDGEVRQVRLQSTMEESIVTYTVVVDVENTDGTLLPGMTATAEFIVAEAKAVLCVPHAALRYQPETPPISTDATGAAPRAKGGKASKEGTLWLPDGGTLVPLRVTTGLRDATCTEITGEGVTEGQKAVVGVERAKAEGGTSPFQQPASTQRRHGRP